jgi:hypothetical protein
MEKVLGSIPSFSREILYFFFRLFFCKSIRLFWDKGIFMALLQKRSLDRCVSFKCQLAAQKVPSPKCTSAFDLEFLAVILGVAGMKVVPILRLIREIRS